MLGMAIWPNVLSYVIGKMKDKTRLGEIYDKFENTCKLYVYELVCIETTCTTL
jgi:hypothetical protein